MENRSLRIDGGGKTMAWKRQWKSLRQSWSRERSQSSQGNRTDSARKSSIETMESRIAMNADPIWVGGVYVESDIGSDAHGDTFYINFKGGAPGTQLKQLVIDGDQGLPGFDRGDNFFDTVDGGFGADHAFPFKIEQLRAADPRAAVRATVQDGSTKLVLDFDYFQEGDLLVFSIDVDEVEFFDPNEKDLPTINDGFDPITSGVEFQTTKFKATFVAPYYEDASGSSEYLNRYDPVLVGTNLELPADDNNGLRDRSAGTAVKIVQTPKPISLAGTVYVDNDLNLQQASSESGIAGVTLQLWKKDGNSFVNTGLTTVTDSNGNYKFGTNLGLMPGTYQVREVQPTGYFSVGATIGKIGSTPVGAVSPDSSDILTEIEIPLGDLHATDLDFAEAQPAQISGSVYNDANNDGIRDPSEIGIAGVTIRVEAITSLGAQAAVVVTTDSNGRYQVTGLRPGRYRVIEVDQPSAYLDGKDTPGKVNGQTRGNNTANDRLEEIRLDGNESGIEYNFGEILGSSLSGHVYHDRNNDGTRQDSEQLLSNVLVQIYDSKNSLVAEKRTDANGFYKFENLRPGTYRLVETTPAGYIDGKDSVGTLGGPKVGTLQGNDEIASISLPQNAHGINYDFGELLPGSIAGRVVADTNDNCLIDAPGDKLLEGVLIQLFDQNGTKISETRTDAFGEYTFSGLLPGTYTVKEIQPDGYFQGDYHAGTGGGDTSVEDVVSNIQLNSGDDFTDYDFCEIPPSELSGKVYVDLNNDCLHQSGEPPLAGVRIDLVNSNGIVVQSTVTSQDGTYRFTNLRAGTYSVRESQPQGYLQGGQMAGSGGGDDTIDDIISAISIPPAVSFVDYDFCEVLPAELSGYVWADLDEDCVFDTAEKPIGNVLIELLNDKGIVVATTRTNSEGFYQFGNLRPGEYSVRETQPDGYFQGGQMAPPGNGDASVDDLVSAIRIVSGDKITHVDFCEVPPAVISGYVYQDGPVLVTKDGLPPATLRPQRDGVRTSDDTPISGVTIELRTLLGQRFPSNRALPGIYSGDTISVKTDARGYFEFRGLRAGSYHVYQVQPKDYFDGLDVPGSTGGSSVNKEDTLDPQTQSQLEFLTTDTETNPNSDAILNVFVSAGQFSIENDFSEIRVQKEPVPPPPPLAPPIPPGPPILPPPVAEAPPMNPAAIAPYIAPPQMVWTPIPFPPPGHVIPYTWHLSVVNGGYPRGMRADRLVSEEVVERNAELLDVVAWTVQGMDDGLWVIVSTKNQAIPRDSRIVFDVPRAKPLAGDFNGDGVDELALFLDGEWLLDLNGNGRWDKGDLWIRLGSAADRPVVGDWDHDGKDDVGIFGPEWLGDKRALAHEPGLPDPENMELTRPKNLPPRPEEATDGVRVMQRTSNGPARADEIDHVFRFGYSSDYPIAGDWNGDGVASIGVFRGGRWFLDTDGDGRFTARDSVFEFGDVGDKPVVGDFDGNGIDEIAVHRGNQVIVDSNGNGKIDVTDRVFELDVDPAAESYEVIAGDFDGNGKDEPAVHRTSESRVPLEARRKAG